MTRSAKAASCHTCDCRTVCAHEPIEGVELISERGHVRAKVGVLLERADGLQLDGPDWVDRLEKLLAELSYSERTALLAVPLNGAQRKIALPAQEMLDRAKTEWLPELLVGGSLFPHLQPIVSLPDGRTIGYESLLRAHLDGRELSGGQIVAAAQAHGAIFTLDLAGRTVALEQAMPKLDPDQTLFVNFTPTAIYDPAVCLRTTWAVARRHGLSLERICFEVVETERFPDISFLRRILDEYRSHGAMVALDDLGSGNTSLAYLAQLRPDIVKLDRMLVTGIDVDSARARLVGGLIDYAHELDIRVVAEGVETADELAAVIDLGADLAQGYYLGRSAAEPVAVDPARVTGARHGSSGGTTIELRDRALAAATSGVVISDARVEGMPIIYANPAFERLTGYMASEIIGRSCKFVQGPETDPQAIEVMGEALREGRECQATVLNYRKNGEVYWCDVHLAPVRDARGELLQFVAVQTDVTDRVRADTQLRQERDRANHLASHDALTGLLNRRAFRTRAEARLRDAAAGPFAAALFLDVDRFKQINDRHGHDVGDAVLCNVAHALRDHLGPDGIAARQAGDEFLGFLVGPDETELNDCLQQLAMRLGSVPVPGHAGETVRVSCGWSLARAGTRSLSELVRDADVSMYADKRERSGLVEATALEGHGHELAI